MTSQSIVHISTIFYSFIFLKTPHAKRDITNKKERERKRKSLK